MLKAIQVGFGLAIGVGVAYLALIAAIILLPLAVAYVIVYPAETVAVVVWVGLPLLVWWCWQIFNRPPTD
jgi:hypothetical protein